MTPEQAVMLYSELFRGEIVGVNNDGDTAEKDTPLAAMLNYAGSPHLSYSYRSWTPDKIRESFKSAADFLREWAGQLEAAGECLVKTIAK